MSSKARNKYVPLMKIMNDHIIIEYGMAVS